MDPSDVAAFALQGGLMAEQLNEGQITIGNTTYPAAVGRAPLEEQVTGGGFVTEGQRLVRVRKAVLPTMPPVGTKATIEGRVWVVKSATGKDLDPKWTLRMEPHSKPR